MGLLMETLVIAPSIAAIKFVWCLGSLTLQKSQSNFKTAISICRSAVLTRERILRLLKADLMLAGFSELPVPPVPLPGE